MTRAPLIVRWAGLGALSGTLATLVVWVPLMQDFSPHFGDWFDALNVIVRRGGVEMIVGQISIAPGLIFGLVVGYALKRRGLAGGWRYPAYVAAAAVSYFVTVQITINLKSLLANEPFLIGVVAGALGAALLAAPTAALMPAFRRRATIGFMVLAGAACGSTLMTLFVVFIVWQAGYAAAMSTALED